MSCGCASASQSARLEHYEALEREFNESKQVFHDCPLLVLSPDSVRVNEVTQYFLDSPVINIVFLEEAPWATWP